MPSRLALLLLLTVAASLHAEPPADWHRYSAPGGTFMVCFPRPPLTFLASPQRPATESVSIDDSSAGVRLVKLPQRHPKDSSYLVMYRDIDKPAPGAADTKNYLLGRQLGVIQSAQGRLVEERDIAYEGQPGREFIFETRRIGLVKCRVYLLGRTVYHLSYFSMSPDRGKLSEADPFFDSFSLAK